MKKLRNPWRDSARLDYLERVLKQSEDVFPLVKINTIPMIMGISACNKYEGEEAGGYVGKTLREAVDKAIEKEREYREEKEREFREFYDKQFSTKGKLDC